jgi:hypothetical protein
MRRSIGCVIGLALLAGSCGIGGSGSSPQGSGSVSSSPSSTPGAADPLVGTWRQDYTCQEQVRTFMRTIHHSTPAQLRGLADLRELPSAAPRVVIAEFAPEFAWGPNADTRTARTAAALCKGAPDRSKQMLVRGGTSPSTFPTLFSEVW